MAHTSSQPVTLYSRDLKYMLDSRHSAAPPRHKGPRRLLVALTAVAVTVGAWTGTWLLPAGRDAAPPMEITTAGLPPIARVHPLPNLKYTQTAQPVSKTRTPSNYRFVDPHPGEGRVTPRIAWKSYDVRRGDTLGGIFNRFSIDLELAGTLVKHETGAALKKLLPKHEMRFGFDDDGKLTQLRYQLNRMEELVVRFEDGDGFSVHRQNIPTQIRERVAGQTIGSSLFQAASKAGLSDRLIMDLVSIFGWDIDFALDIRAGDSFSILYEEMFRDGESIGTGDIVAAEFVASGEVHQAVRHINDNGRKDYFDLDGNSLRGTFLRTPMRVSRITSGFSKRRYHPVLKKWRAHRGVDYGAPTGTPVLATGDGRMHSAGRKGGYGKTVVLKHGGEYSTLYAHLSRYAKGVSRGARVQQGDVIGYVGSTGMVTGPHLHYEFRVNGTHRNPLTYETPKAESIAERYRESFLVMARDRIDQIADKRGEQIASR